MRLAAWRRVATVATGGVAAGAVVWAVAAEGHALAAAGGVAWRAAWTVAPITALHCVQLWLSSVAWRGLIPAARLGLAGFFRLRLIREAINSLLPVAHVGGDIVAGRLLAAEGVGLAAAAASIVVDISLEVAALAIFVAAGLACLAWVAGAGHALVWRGGAAACVLLVLGLWIALRLGIMRLVEAAMPGLFEGLGDAVHALQRRPGPLVRSVALHALSWSLGSLETWTILRATGEAVTPLAAVAIESIGTVARTAGFAVPGALAIQEGGFALAALAVGSPAAAGLAVSLVKRLREIVVGLIGLSVWGAWRKRRA